MAYWDHDHREPTKEERDAALAKLEELRVKAEEIEKSVEDKRKALAAEFMEFVKADGLRHFEYDSGINEAVYDFTSTAHLHEYGHAFEFWIPSNIGC